MTFIKDVVLFLSFENQGVDEITLEEGYKDDYELKERILMELENLVFSFLHVSPDLIVHYPLPIREGSVLKFRTEW